MREAIAAQPDSTLANGLRTFAHLRRRPDQAIRDGPTVEVVVDVAARVLDRMSPLRTPGGGLSDRRDTRSARTAEFTAHAEIRTILLGTGDEEFVEDTSTEHHWGRGRSGTGKNTLGRLLMRTRTQLRADLTQNASTQGVKLSGWQ
jgi:hypothetical protein